MAGDAEFSNTNDLSQDILAHTAGKYSSCYSRDIADVSGDKGCNGLNNRGLSGRASS